MTDASIPKVSVMIPVYNAERYLADAMRSVLAQTFTEFELIVVDDGSTDDSLEILRSFEGCDERVQVISRPNTGYVTALNEMIDTSRGVYLARMDSDDIAMPDRFERQVRYLDENPECVAVGSDALLIDADGDPLTTWRFERTAEELDGLHIKGIGPRLVHPVVMLRADAMRQLGGYRVEMESAEDMDLWLRLAEIGELANLDATLIQYRVHPKSVTHTSRSKQDELMVRIHNDACARRGIEPTPIDTAPSGKKHDLVSYYRKWGWWAYNSGHMRSARKYAKRSVAAAPFAIDSWKLAIKVMCRSVGR